MSTEITRLEADRDSYRNSVSSYLQTANSMRFGDEGARLVWLEKAVEAQKVVVEIHQRIVDLYVPCKACGRKVKSPCHDIGGMMENGPWDGSCEHIIRGRKD